MDDILRHTAELTLIYAVPLVTGASENSRLSGLQRKLQKIVVDSLAKLPTLEREDELKVIDFMEAWGKDTGWLNSQKHLGTLVSFCVAMMEQSEFTYNPKIYTTLTEIIDHLIKGKQFYPLSINAGEIAALKWLKLFPLEAELHDEL